MGFIIGFTIAKLQFLLPSKTELLGLIHNHQHRKQGAKERSRHWLDQSAIHFQKAFEFLRVLSYALGIYLESQAKIASYRTLSVLEWSMRRGNNVSHAKSDTKSKDLSNLDKTIENKGENK
jgi:hypothetical protein